MWKSVRGSPCAPSFTGLTTLTDRSRAARIALSIVRRHSLTLTDRPALSINSISNEIKRAGARPLRRLREKARLLVAEAVTQVERSKALQKVSLRLRSQLDQAARRVPGARARG